MATACWTGELIIDQKEVTVEIVRKGRNEISFEDTSVRRKAKIMKRCNEDVVMKYFDGTLNDNSFSVIPIAVIPHNNVTEFKSDLVPEVAKNVIQFKLERNIFLYVWQKNPKTPMAMDETIFAKKYFQSIGKRVFGIIVKKNTQLEATQRTRHLEEDESQPIQDFVQSGEQNLAADTVENRTVQLCHQEKKNDENVNCHERNSACVSDTKRMITLTEAIIERFTTSNSDSKINSLLSINDDIKLALIDLLVHRKGQFKNIAIITI